MVNIAEDVVLAMFTSNAWLSAESIKQQIADFVA